MKQRLLVTGARGFVGRHLVASLAGVFDVHAVTTRSSTGPFTEGVKWHTCDLMDHSARSALVDNVRPSHLVHLAWVTEYGEYWSSPDNLSWVSASLMLLKEFAEAGGQRVVMAGTCAEYDWALDPPYAESSPTRGERLYASAKLATSQIASAYSAETSLSMSWARLFYVYGPREHKKRLVPFLIRTALEGRVPVPRTPENVIDLVYVADAASALAALLISNVEGPVNICSGDPIRISELALRVAETVGIEVPRTDEGAVEHGVFGDPSRLHLEVGYEPKWNLSEGLFATIDWWKDREMSVRKQQDRRYA